MSYYEVTVNLYENPEDKYKSSEIYSQRVDELDLQAVIRAVNPEPMPMPDREG